ncbi:hypothetical protein [Metabacillus sp. FJAT-53654]|uniref:Uncharacterized protein n=1 Tax=Metabacillus rhizosphaerae TaxID=3117747 RepID=A0ABZ2MN92_9BACI
MFENELYTNIPLLLKSLIEQQFTLEVATSTPTNKYFDLVVGSNLNETKTSKTEIIQYILDK